MLIISAVEQSEAIIQVHNVSQSVITDPQRGDQSLLVGVIFSQTGPDAGDVGNNPVWAP